MASQKETNELLKQALGYEKEARKILAEKTKELMTQKGLSEASAKIEARKNKDFKEQVELVKEIRGQLADAKREASETIGVLMQQEKSLKGLTGIQASLVNHERAKIDILANGGRMSENTRNTLESISSLNQELLQTSAEDVVTRGELERQIEGQLKGLKGLGVAGTELKNIMEDEYRVSQGISSMTEKQQVFLDKQLKVYDGIKDTIGGILETASLLTSTVGGVFGSALIGAGYAAEALGQNVREMGGYLGGATVSSTALGFIFKDAASTTKSLSQEMGGLNDVTFKTQFNANLMATNMGITGDESAKVLGNFSRLNGGSQDVAMNLAQSTKELAQQNGLVPSAVMADVAGSAKAFAEYGKQGGKNIAEAAVAAGKLGVNMSSLTTVTDSLLDFETSITKELELGAMLGKNINLNRARALAYEQNIGGAVKETLKELGGIEAFNQMDIFAKRETAALLGVSVDEFQKMAMNSDKLNKDGSIQQSQWSQIYETLKGVASGPMGSILKTTGSLVMASAQMAGSFAQMGRQAPLVGGLFQKMGKPLAGGAKTGIPFVSAANDMTPVQNGPMPNPAGKGGIMQSLGKINMSAVLKGAAAMVLVAGSVYILGKALQEFKDVGLADVGVAAAGMLIIGAAMAGLGMLIGNPVVGTGILLGAAAMVLVAGSIYILGKAIQEMATGFSMLGGMGEQLTGLISIIPGIFGLAAAFSALGASLGIIAVAGMAALPAMIGLAAVGAGLGFLINSVTGDDSNTSTPENESITKYHTDMINKMELLISATEASRNIYIDGEKFTSYVQRKAEKLPIVNTTAVKNT